MILKSKQWNPHLKCSMKPLLIYFVCGSLENVTREKKSEFSNIYSKELYLV